MTIRQNTLNENENTDFTLLKNWDQQKTLPVSNNRNSSKKRKVDSKKCERKSERKCKNKSLINAHG